jgi:hypothetical protein
LVLTVAWAIGVGVGFSALFSYASRPGSDSRAPVQWPADSGLHRGADRATLIVFVHPRCTCSRATLVELGHTLERTRDKLAATVVFVRPHGAPAGWDVTSYQALVARMPGVASTIDTDAVEAGRFGAATSGATLLYTRDGRLAFTGGLTAERGHEGDSFGQERIVALLTTGKADRAESPVFGCALDDEKSSKERP